jgi:hypothetical protein
VVEIAKWDWDELSYAEGAREKSTVFSSESPEFSFLKPTHRYLAKKSVHRHPVQFWMEIVAYRLGCIAGVPVPPAFVAIDGADEGRVLIEWFFNDWDSSASSTVVYGTGFDWLLTVDPMMDKEKGRRHTLARARRAITFLPLKFASKQNQTIEQKAKLYEVINAILLDAALILLFDALIGNNDRRPEN